MRLGEVALLPLRQAIIDWKKLTATTDAAMRQGLAVKPRTDFLLPLFLLLNQKCFAPSLPTRSIGTCAFKSLMKSEGVYNDKGPEEQKQCEETMIDSAHRPIVLVVGKIFQWIESIKLTDHEESPKPTLLVK